MGKVKLITKGSRNRIKQIIDKTRTEVIKLTSPVIREHIKMREEITKTWSAENQPQFIPRIIRRSDGIYYSIEIQGTPAEGTDKTVYELLRDGTDTRHAKMTKDYRRSTSPNSLYARQKRGGVAYVSRNFRGISPDDGQEGITARNWDQVINEKLARRFRRRIVKGYVESANKRSR